MTYAKIQDDQIVKVGPTPNWRTDDGPLTPEQWRDQGYLPVHYDQPEHDPLLQQVNQLAQDEWLIEPERVVVTYEIHETPIEQLRDAKLQAATNMRWSVMTGGITLPSGISIGTGIDDQNRITSVVANAALAGLTDSDEVDFKAESGWVHVTIAEVKQIAGVIGQFVQACYSAERAHHNAINALETREEIAAYGASTGWPSQGA